ncbi:mechanosensitive ion channel family protein [Pseudoruegeria sp. SK021]|uniref:mechanosensitive ion channel family protein n=1 Tax=Pseudoruegeria sp. SK021 TaxID=1933035 RepID=UPI000A329C69|nr:mechanosensitive ion channel family protein [Pseudoruegeria sp. SK021]
MKPTEFFKTFQNIFPWAKDLWLRLADYLNHTTWGLPLDRIAMAAGVFLVFVLLRRPQRYLLMVVMGQLASRPIRNVDPQILQALRGPAGVLPLALGSFIAFEILSFDQTGVWARLASHIVVSLVLFALFWTFFELMTPLVASLKLRERALNPTLADVVRRTLKGGIVLIGGAIVLEEWGIKIAPLLTGMGIFGAALALGAQNLVKNLIAGFLILAERRFSYGHWVKVDGVVEGTVEFIGFRSTRVRQFDDASVEVPNSEFSENALINYTKMRRRRIFWSIGVPYSTSIEQLQVIRGGIEQYIVESGDFVSPSAASTFIRVDSFGSSSINIMVYCFTITTVWGEWLIVKEKLAYAIVDIVSKAGSSFAFPSTSVYVETLPEGIPDRFVPPLDDHPQ